MPSIHLYENVLTSMRARIASGEWAPDTLIPREIDLCKEYNVSRSTIRMAMARLVDDHQLVRVKGVGTYVTGNKRLLHTTLFISSFARELEVNGLQPHTELLSFCSVAAIPEINEKLGLDENARLVRITRLRYAEGLFDKGPIVLTTSYFSIKLMPLFEQADLEKQSFNSILRGGEYERMLFNKHLHASQLSDRDCRLLGVSPNSLAICITSVASDQNGNPLEYTESLYPQDKNTFELQARI